HEGARVVINGRAQDDVDRVVGELRQEGREALGIASDLSTQAGAHALAADVLKQAQQLHILVNNAGMGHRGPFWEMSDESFEYQTNVNYRSPFILCQHAARHMIEHKITG